MQDYRKKTDDYFSNARKHIEPLLAGPVERVLEVGCGAGATLQWLKQTGYCKSTYGIEITEAWAEAARLHADRVVVGDAEKLIDTAFAGVQFDLILCLDVLEHMVDPWHFVDQLPHLLTPGGRIVFSIPNVRNLRVVLPLVFCGRWRYEETGILDRTHLRFFSRQSALDLATTEALRVDRWCRTKPPRWSKLGVLDTLTLGLLRDFVAVQYLIASTRRSDESAPPVSTTISAT